MPGAVSAYLLLGADDLLPDDLEGEDDLLGVEEGLLYWLLLLFWL